MSSNISESNKHCEDNSKGCNLPSWGGSLAHFTFKPFPAKGCSLPPQRAMHCPLLARISRTCQTVLGSLGLPKSVSVLPPHSPPLAICMSDSLSTVRGVAALRTELLLVKSLLEMFSVRIVPRRPCSLQLGVWALVSASLGSLPSSPSVWLTGPGPSKPD